MEKNVGSIDRVLRLVAGLVIIGLGVAFQSWWGAIGVVPLFTALTSRCGPYALLGISTCKVAEKES
jgi:predicted RND superfamily exporter protein